MIKGKIKEKRLTKRDKERTNARRVLKEMKVLSELYRSIFAKIQEIFLYFWLINFIKGKEICYELYTYISSKQFEQARLKIEKRNKTKRNKRVGSSFNLFL